MRKLTLIIVCLLIGVTFSIASERAQVDVFGKIIPVTTYSNITPILVYCDNECLDVYFNIGLKRIEIEVVSLVANNVVYSSEINSTIVQNLRIDVSCLPMGEYRIRFINLNSGDTMYGLFEIGM